MSRRRNINRSSIKNLNTILLDDTHLFWFSWGKLKLATHKGYIIIPLEVHEHSKKFLDWQIKGSRLLRRGDNFFLHVTFRKEVEERVAEGVLGVDINEKSIDLAIVKACNIRFIK